MVQNTLTFTINMQYLVLDLNYANWYAYKVIVIHQAQEGTFAQDIGQTQSD